MSGELSHFEEKSALTPKNTPYGILGGFILSIIIFFLVSTFGTNEAVDDLKEAKAAGTASETAPAANTGNDDIDI